MTTSSPSKDGRHARRLLVTLLIATAAAAVTAGVVLKKHHPAESAAQHIAAGQALARAAAAQAAPAFPSGVEWRDAGNQPAPPSGSESASINDVPDDGATRSDPSVPSAAAALRRAADSSEDAATF
jgi:hypothetical protein